MEQGTGQLFVTSTNAAKPAFAFSSSGNAGANEFDLVVRVSDRGGLSGDGNVRVQLTETNVAPAFIQATFTVGIDENAADAAVVGSIDATDINDGQTVSFSIAPTGASANAPFPFIVQSATGADVSAGADGTAVIRVASGSGGAGAGLLNFEGSTQSFEAVLTATDSHSTTPLSTTALLTIQVQEVAEAPYFDGDRRRPNSVRFDVTVEEGASAGTAVRMADAAEETTVGQGVAARLTATDDDVVDAGTVRYSVRVPTGAAPTSQSATACGSAVSILGDGSSGTVGVVQAGVLDFERSPSFRCTIVATDGRGATDTADVIVALIDSNDAPTVAADQVLSVGEDAAAGAAVGTVAVSDPDSREEWRSFTVLLAGDPALFAGQNVSNPGTGVDDQEDEGANSTTAVDDADPNGANAT